jgi:hypothetical protein
VTGAYTLQIVPAASCGLGVASVSFNVTAAPGGTAPHPGVQAVYVSTGAADPSALELEVVHEANAIRGGFATRHDGVLSLENVQVWVHAVGASEITRVGTGRGEALSGQLLGYVAIGAPGSAEGSLGSCSTTENRFTLRTR